MRGSQVAFVAQGMHTTSDSETSRRAVPLQEFARQVFLEEMQVRTSCHGLCSGGSDRIKPVKRLLRKNRPLLLGKLRVRLSTVAPGETFTVALPMLAGRRNGGERTATAHLSMRVILHLPILSGPCLSLR